MGSRNSDAKTQIDNAPHGRLQIQKIGSVAVDFVDIDDCLDKDFKPGLYKQTEAFLAEDCHPANHCTTGRRTGRLSQDT